MRNQYKIIGDYVFIKLTSKKHGELETKISKEDLELVDSMPYTWYAKYSPKVNNFYVAANVENETGKRTNIKLHRWILQPNESLMVDHINHDTLDNSRENLRTVTNAQNQYNRKGSNKHNTTKVLGVSYRKDIGKFRARVYKDRELVYSEHFKRVEDAETAVIEVRSKIFGKYA